MEDAPREALIRLIRHYGTELASDDRRLEALLRDTVPGFRAEISVLVAAAREGVPQDLLDGQTSLPLEARVPRLVQALEEMAYRPEAARWAVAAWGAALGLQTPIPNPAAGEEEPRSPDEPGPLPPLGTEVVHPTTTRPSWPRSVVVVPLVGIGIMVATVIGTGQFGWLSRGEVPAATSQLPIPTVAVTVGTTLTGAPTELARAVVVLASQPPAEVLIDGQSYGFSPLQVAVEPGAHDIELRARNHRDWVERIAVEPGATHAVQADLQPINPREVLHLSRDPDRRPVLGHTRYRDDRGVNQLRVRTSEFSRSDGVVAIAYLDNAAFGIADFDYTVEMRWYLAGAQGGAPTRSVVETKMVPRTARFEDLTACAPGYALDSAGSGQLLRLEVWIDGSVVIQFPFRVSGGVSADFLPSSCEDPAGGRRDRAAPTSVVGA